MKRILVCAVFFGAVMCMGSACFGEETTFVSIGTGGITGLYYPAGSAIAKLINKKRQLYGIRANVESTDGSVFNISAIASGNMQFGIVQSDRLYQAVHGHDEWAAKGPQKDLRAVFGIHSESVTLVAAADSGIRTLNDLRGKRVNIGNAGSGQRQNAIDALMAGGIRFDKDLKAEGVKSSEAPALLQDGKLDAFFYTVGHPSSAFREAASGPVKVCFIPVSGPEIEELLKAKPCYAKCSFSPKMYPGAVNEEDNIETFCVKATLCTSVHVPDKVVYAVTKEVLSNLDEFRKVHPAFEELTRKGMPEGLSAPIHPGAEKYFKEIRILK